MCSTSPTTASNRPATTQESRVSEHTPNAGEEVLTSDHVLEYPYSRSVGPVIGAFLTGWRDGKVLGATAPDGRVIVPPTEYDPTTAEPTGELVEVGPAGALAGWAGVGRPPPHT